MSDKELSGLQKFAAHKVLVFSGSLLVLSLTLNNIGFRRVVEAYADSLVWKMKQKNQCPVSLDDEYKNQMNERVMHLEDLSHPRGTK